MDKGQIMISSQRPNEQRQINSFNLTICVLHKSRGLISVHFKVTFVFIQLDATAAVSTNNLGHLAILAKVTKPV